MGRAARRDHESGSDYQGCIIMVLVCHGHNHGLVTLMVMALRRNAGVREANL